MIKNILILIYVFINFNINSQSYVNNIGGEINYNNRNIWNSIYNTSLISLSENKIAIGSSVSNYYLLNNLYSSTLSAYYKTKFAFIGLSINQDGTKNLNTQNYSVFISRKLNDKFLIGSKINMTFLNSKLEKLKHNNFFTFDFSGTFVLNNKSTISFNVHNPSFNNIDNYFSITSDVVFILSTEYKFSENLLLYLDFIKNINFKTNLSLGIKYMINKRIEVFYKFQLNSYKNGFGILFNLDKLKVLLSTNYSFYLGASPTLSIEYNK